MKLLIVSDYYMYHNNGNYYFESQEKCDFFYRYLRVFEKIRLVARCIEENQIKSSRILLNEDTIEYVPVLDYHGPFEYMKSYISIGKSMNGIVKGCDAALLQLPCTLAMRASKQVLNAGIPYATEVVYDAEDGWKSETSLFRKLLWKRIDKNMRYICNNADGVACVTEFYLQRHYFSLKKGSFKSNYSSLALDKSFYSGARDYPRGHTLTIAHTANKIFYDWRKGHKETIEAVALLKKMGITANVRFAGAIVDKSPDRLKQLAKDLGVENQVEFVGFLNRSELDHFLSSADIFVLPTKAEGLPRVLIEAMAKGLPCVSTRVSGNFELISSDFLVDYDDVAGMAERLKNIITNKAVYEMESKSNFEKSLNYEASILQNRRDLYYSNLKERAIRLHK